MPPLLPAIGVAGPKCPLVLGQIKVQFGDGYNDGDVDVEKDL